MRIVSWKHGPAGLPLPVGIVSNSTCARAPVSHPSIGDPLGEGSYNTIFGIVMFRRAAGPCGRSEHARDQEAHAQCDNDSATDSSTHRGPVSLPAHAPRLWENRTEEVAEILIVSSRTAS